MMTKREELVEAMKLGRQWTEWVSLQCGYHGCTPETCSSKAAERDLAVIDAMLSTIEEPSDERE